MFHECMIYVGLLNAILGVRIILLMIEFVHTMAPLIFFFFYVLEILIGHFC
jgi:hypothetical protein